MKTYTEEESKELLKDVEGYGDRLEKIKFRALGLLARRDHSRLELKRKLIQKLQVTPDEFSTLMKYLGRMGYLTDETSLAERLSKEWLTKGKGPKWIQGKLRERGLPQVQIAESTDSLKIALKRKLGRRRVSSLTPIEKSKLIRSLMGRGFAYEQISQIISLDI